MIIFGQALTAVATARLATVQRRLDLAAASSYISIRPRACLAGTIAAYDRHEWIALSDALTEYLCDLRHDGLSAHRAPEPLERGSLATSLRKARATRVTAATAVRLW